MNNQNLNDNNNLNEVNTQEKTPSLMRETLDKDGNVISPTNNFGPDTADKTINAVETFIDTEDHKHKFSEDEVKKLKGKAMLCYVPLVPLYFVLVNKIKQYSYLRFHANQGLIVTIMWVLAFFLSKIIKIIFVPRSMVLNDSLGFASIISYLLYCVCFLSSVFGIINTYNDSSKELPLIGKIKLLKEL